MQIEFLIVGLLIISGLWTVGEAFFNQRGRHKHKKYDAIKRQRTIREVETYERWDDNIPVLRRETENIQNADYVQPPVNPPVQQRPIDRVKGGVRNG